MLSIHVRVNDQNGKPTAVRVRFTGPDGQAFAPAHRAAEFPTGRGEAVGGHLFIAGEVWHTIDGTCEVRLPAGVPIRVQVTKGPEFVPLDQTVTLGSGQMALRFTIHRWIDCTSEDWFSGDSRVQLVSPHDAALDGAAEGLTFVNLLAGVEEVPSIAAGRTFPVPVNLGAFSGQQTAREAHGTCVAVNTINRHPVLGTVGLLHAHRPVYPLAFGGNDATDDWSICAWCDQCHRKRGFTVWVDAGESAAGVTGGEALIACLLGKIDAIETRFRPRRTPLLPWCYRLWNAGFLVPLIGGSGQDANSIPPGYPRTYARISDAETPGFANWIEAIRAGNSFVTNGPLLRFGTVPNGDVFRVTATAASIVPFEQLELVHNGTVFGSENGQEQDGRWVAEGDWSLPTDSAGWVAVRCRGGIGQPLHNQPVFAHSAPQRLGQAYVDPAAREVLQMCLQQTREWLETQGRFAEERRKQEHLARCAEAETRLARM